VKKTEGKDTFILRLSFLRHIDGLTDTEAGQLIRAVRCYADGVELPKMDRPVEMVFGFLKMQIDEENKKYAEKCDVARKSINRRWNKDTDVSNGIPNDTKQYERIPTYTDVSEKIPTYTDVKNTILTRDKDTDSDVDVDIDTDNNINTESTESIGSITEGSTECITGDTEGAGATLGLFGEEPIPKKPKPQKEPQHKHGEYGWVLLTDTAHDRLKEKYGESELAEMIACVDGTAERTQNKAGYVRWDAVLHQCAKGQWHKKAGYGTQPQRGSRYGPQRVTMDDIRDAHKRYNEVYGDGNKQNFNLLGEAKI